MYPAYSISMSTVLASTSAPWPHEFPVLVSYYQILLSLHQQTCPTSEPVQYSLYPQDVQFAHSVTSASGLSCVAHAAEQKGVFLWPVFLKGLTASAGS